MIFLVYIHFYLSCMEFIWAYQIFGTVFCTHFGAWPVYWEPLEAFEQGSDMIPSVIN
jgi:hypothetical protein